MPLVQNNLNIGEEKLHITLTVPSACVCGAGLHFTSAAEGGECVLGTDHSARCCPELPTGPDSSAGTGWELVPGENQTHIHESSPVYFEIHDIFFYLIP